MSFHDEIRRAYVIKYAESRGLTNVSVTDRPWGKPNAGGLWLVGEGKGKDDWPLVWEIARELGISWGCGNHNKHQIKLDQLVIPIAV